MASFYSAVYIWVSQGTVFSLWKELLSMYILRIMFLCSKKTGNELEHEKSLWPSRAAGHLTLLHAVTAWACFCLGENSQLVHWFVKMWMIQNMHLSSFCKSSERNTDTAAAVKFPTHLCMRCSVRSYLCHEVETLPSDQSIQQWKAWKTW